MGLMFQKERPDGGALTAADAVRRQRNETLTEIIQHKGASECYFGPGLVTSFAHSNNCPGIVSPVIATNREHNPLPAAQDISGKY